MDVLAAVVEDVTLSGDDDGCGFCLVCDIDGRVCRGSDGAMGKNISTDRIIPGRQRALTP